MLKSGLTLDHGNFKIIQSPKGIRVTDGEGTITTNYTHGKILYVRDNEGGALYVNGEMVGRHFSPNTSNSSESIYSGSGSIKNIKQWANTLTEEQIYHFNAI